LDIASDTVATPNGQVGIQVLDALGRIGDADTVKAAACLIIIYDGITQRRLSITARTSRNDYVIHGENAPQTYS